MHMSCFKPNPFLSPTFPDVDLPMPCSIISCGLPLLTIPVCRTCPAPVALSYEEALALHDYE